MSGLGGLASDQFGAAGNRWRNETGGNAGRQRTAVDTVDMVDMVDWVD